MTMLPLLIGNLAAVLVALLPAATAHALAQTWVAGVGDDNNPCTRASPCRSFGGAILKTDAGGEILCVDTGGFGTVVISQSVTIDCSNTLGSIVITSGPAITINGANIVVRLRGLTLNGEGGGSMGIDVAAAGTVF